MIRLKSSRSKVLILAFTLVVVMLGYGMVIPIIPFYVEEMGAGGMELGLLVACYALMRLIFGPMWGSLSDRVGRKPVLMVGVFGYAITMFFFGLATQLWMLFVARIVSGLLSSATSPTTLAYISDSTTEEDRGGGMGILGAAIGLGTILGPGLGGCLSGDSLARPFFLAAALSLVAVALIYLLLPESLPPQKRRSITLTLSDFSARRGSVTKERANELWAALTGPIGVLLLLAFLVTCGVTTFYGIFGLYVLERFGYGPAEVGTMLMVMGLVSAVAQGALCGPLIRRRGELWLIRASLGVGGGSFLLIMIADGFSWLLVSTGFFFMVTALLMPALTALISKRTTMEQGITMGLSNSAMSLGRIAGPLWGGFAFDLNIRYPFWGGAAILLAGFLVSLVRLNGERVLQTDGTLESAE
ncbi:MAG TPA: MFS transporter [Anaerolineae bacterium]|jgi:DHA1 family multidrug resistance protein-like MFS transporter|nr:MFS transporter [Anaerolineae bacterium]